MNTIKGVNLGNWLVLEKWMSTELYDGLDARDEDEFYHQLSEEEAALRLHLHRSYFIQERDFLHIHALGLNLVRIPVPYYIFGGCGYGIGCIEYLDRAFKWAQRYDLKILIDLHTVPDSQNGFDNGGLTGVCKWHKNPANIDLCLDILGRLAQRYAGHPALYGIELINEPVNDSMWAAVHSRYTPADLKRAEGSEPVPTDILRDYYLKGYDTVRKYCGPETAVVLHDHFDLEEWDNFMPEDRYTNVVIDTHMYLFMEQMTTGSKTMEEHEAGIRSCFRDRLARAQQFHPVIVGEWSLGNKYTDIAYADPSSRQKMYRRLAQVQKDAFSVCEGQIFWSYKVHAPGRDNWDLQRAIDCGYMSL